MVLVVLEVEVEYKDEEEDDERVIWEVLRSRWNLRRKENDEQEILGLLEVGVEFKEEIEDEQVIWGCWRSRWSSRRRGGG